MAQDDGTAPTKVKISASEEPYPGYELSFEGDAVGTVFTVRGPHSFMLPLVAPDVNVKVLVTHKDHDPGVPSLKIELRRRPNDT